MASFKLPKLRTKNHKTNIEIYKKKNQNLNNYKDATWLHERRDNIECRS